jgi:hypothetical protein
MRRERLESLHFWPTFRRRQRHSRPKSNPISSFAVLNEADTPAAAIRSAQANLIVVFEAIGVAVVCVDSYAGDHSVVVVRIVGEEAAERLKAPPGSIGLAPPTSGNERAWFAYVFYDRIERVADRNRVDTSAMFVGPVRRFKTVAPAVFKSPAGKPGWQESGDASLSISPAPATSPSPQRTGAGQKTSIKLGCGCGPIPPTHMMSSVLFCKALATSEEQLHRTPAIVDNP